MPAFTLFLFLALVALTGCTRNPSLEISGSFFPAWMLSILIGIVATVITRRVFVWARIDPFLKPHVLVYGALALSLTLSIWLIFYS